MGGKGGKEKGRRGEWVKGVKPLDGKRYGELENLMGKWERKLRLELFRSRVQARRKTGHSVANSVHQLPVAMPGGFGGRFHERFHVDYVHHPRWNSTGAQVPQHPLHRLAEQQETDDSVPDGVSCR